jgi:hypothetical protein
MSRAIVAALSLAVVLTTACTVLSGIDDLEKGSGKADAGPKPEPVGLPTDGGADVQVPPPPPAAPTNTCGALGDWTTCSTDTTDFASCAERCLRVGKTCVESCCGYDIDNVTFVGDAGVAYAYTQECPQSSMPQEALLGACSALATPGTTTSVRCCCR